MSTSRKIAKGFFYTIGSGYIARLCSVGLTLLIRRELPPSIFDDVVLGVVVFTMLASLREFGLMHALLHFQDQVEAFADTHFTLNLLITFCASLLNCGIVLVLVLFFPETFSWTAALVVWIFSALHLLRNLTLTSEALLRMDFEFGRLSLFHGLGTVLALSCALAAARAGWEEWSLILGGYSTVSVFSVVYVLFASTAIWRSRSLKVWPLRLDPVWSRRLLRYGVWIWLGWILQTFIMGYDKLIVWLVAGKEELVFYEYAWWLVQIPTAIITHVLFTYTNTLYSRYQQDRERLSELFSGMIGLVVRVSSPLALVFILNARELLALTPKWISATPILVWLAGYAFMRPLLDECFSLLWAVGEEGTRRSAKVVGVQALVALLLVPCMAMMGGVKGVAYSVGVVAGVGVLGYMIGLRSYVTVRWGRVFGAPALSLALAGMAGKSYTLWTWQNPLLDFVLRSGLMMIVYSGVLGLLERKKIVENILQMRQIFRSDSSISQAQ